MSVIGSNILAGASGSQGYQISRSVRLRSSASAYLNRTPASVTNRQTWTWSGWVKRGRLGATQGLFARNDGSVATYLLFTSSDTLGATSASGAVEFDLATTQVFRDPSAWYHIILVLDTTQATSSNRVKLYVNGSLITALSTASYPTQNYNAYVNTAATHYIGNGNPAGSLGWYSDQYLTEINFIDGQALTPSSFGETNPVTGVWQPKKYTGTYGTNGFFLNFSDNSAATATTIGKDYSGNGNNWTPNNISVTAGVTYDSMLDVPTQWADGGNGRGNYCVMNPLQGLSGFVCSDGNLKVAVSGTATGQRLSTISITSGKWYWENTYLVAPNGDGQYGVSLVDNPTLTVQLGTNAKGWSYSPFIGNIYNGSGTPITTVASASLNDVIGLALDADAGTLAIYKNNSLLYTFSSGVSGGALTPAIGGSSSVAFATAVNFGQRPFAYTPPTGFKALNTLNLPTPTILKGNQYFNAVLYSGNSGSQSITGVGFQPDFVWGKSRNIAENNGLFDAVRGVNKALYSNLTNAEATDPGVSAFNADGFSLNGATINATGYTYVAWNWKEGATQGFDIVTFTGTGVARTVAHSLGVAPSMIIVKNRNTASYGWFVWHTAFGAAGNTDYINLNLTDAKGSGGAVSMWNTTMPTSSVFSLGTYAGVNGNTNTYVAYLFAAVAGYSAFGSYTGNGSADGTFVFTGFRPRYVLIKCSSAGSTNWILHDTAREPYNLATASLYPNLSNAETVAASQSLDILSNGFKLRNTSGDINSSGATYIYAAFAENPFKNALAR